MHVCLNQISPLNLIQYNAGIINGPWYNGTAGWVRDGQERCAAAARLRYCCADDRLKMVSC